jgi:SPP1 gp7 family putative phage head morphogenesis protein
MRSKDLWEPGRRIELNYFNSIRQVMSYLFSEIETITDPFTLVRVLRHSINAPKMIRYADWAAENMVTHTLAANAATWRAAAREGSKGRFIYDALRKEMQGPVGGEVYAQIQRNAAIIKSLPPDISSRVTNYIEQESLKGRRASDIAEDIQNMFPHASRSKAQLIARTECSKTSTALTRARAQNMGLEFYEWRTSEDSRVRESHRKMDHVLIRWSDPPSPEKLAGEKNPPAPYQAGCIWNCRCYPAPVVSFDRLPWPHKVYMNGSIQMLTLSKIKAIGRTIAA